MIPAITNPGGLTASRLVEATPPVSAPSKQTMQAPNPNAPVGPRPTFAETPLDRMRQATLTPPVQKSEETQKASSAAPKPYATSDLLWAAPDAQTDQPLDRKA